MGYAFISYCSRQQKDADSLRLLLHQHHIDTWMAPYDIPEGSAYADVINSAIANAACVVLLLTTDTQSSVYVDKEVERALHYRKTIAPIQLDHVVLNDSFAFYLCNQQIVMVPALDASLPEMQRLITHLAWLCEDRLPQAKEALDASRDRRVRRQRTGRLLTGLGLAALLLLLIIGRQYLYQVSLFTWFEMYGDNDLPTMAAIWRIYSLLAAAAPLAAVVALYGQGLLDPQKTGWSPLRILSPRHILPVLSAAFGGCGVMLHWARQTIQAIADALILYHDPVGPYLVPAWAPPAQSILAAAFACTALACLLLAFLRGRRAGFPRLRAARNRLRQFLAQQKRGAT